MTPTEILQAELDKVVGALQEVERVLTHLMEQTDLKLEHVAELGNDKLALEAAIAKLEA